MSMPRQSSSLSSSLALGGVESHLVVERRDADVKLEGPRHAHKVLVEWVHAWDLDGKAAIAGAAAIGTAAATQTDERPLSVGRIIREAVAECAPHCIP